MSDSIFVGNVITLVSIIKEKGVTLDVSAASVKKIRVKSPDGSAVEYEAAFTVDGSDGSIKRAGYEVAQEGVHVFQPYIEMGEFKGYGEAAAFTARAKI
jgi:hypothetical protein